MPVVLLIILPAFLLFIVGALIFLAMVYMNAAAWVVTWAAVCIAIVHFVHEAKVGLGAQLQKRYRDNPLYAANKWQRYLASPLLIAGAIVCGLFPALLPAVIGFATVDFPLTHLSIFRYRNGAKYNYKPFRSSPAHHTGAVLWGVGLVGSWALMFGQMDGPKWLLLIGAAVGPVTHGIGFLVAWLAKRNAAWLFLL